jgi:transposase-like protein
MESQPVSQLNPPCPFCGHGHGTLNTVTMLCEERRFTYVCRACDQTWTVTDHFQQATFWEESPTLKLI